MDRDEVTNENKGSHSLGGKEIASATNAQAEMQVMLANRRGSQRQRQRQRKRHQTKSLMSAEKWLCKCVWNLRAFLSRLLQESM